MHQLYTLSGVSNKLLEMARCGKMNNLGVKWYCSCWHPVRCTSGEQRFTRASITCWCCWWIWSQRESNRIRYPSASWEFSLWYAHPFAIIIVNMVSYYKMSDLDWMIQQKNFFLHFTRNLNVLQINILTKQLLWPSKVIDFNVRSKIHQVNRKLKSLNIIL